MIGGLFGGFVVALVTIFKKEWSPVTAPVYALLEGLALGGISAMFELRYPGIAIQAVGLTFGTLFVLLLAYKSGIIRATQGFKVGVIAATGGIAVLYLVDMVLRYFNRPVTFIHESGPWGIAFSLFVVIIAALNLVIGFANPSKHFGARTFDQGESDLEGKLHASRNAARCRHRRARKQTLKINHV